MSLSNEQFFRERALADAQKPGDVTTIWRDGTVTKVTAAGRVIALEPVAPLATADEKEAA